LDRFRGRRGGIVRTLVLLYALILKHYPLNKVYPAMTVAQIVLITVYGLTVGEAVDLRHGIGLMLGVASIYLILT